MSRAKKGKKGVEEEETKVVKINYDELIRQNLSEIKMNFDRSGMAYTRLDLNGKKIERPLDTIPSSFGNYRNLRQIDLSFNQITDITT